MAGNFAQVSDRSFGVPDAVNSGQYGIGIVIEEDALSPQSVRDAADALLHPGSPHGASIARLRDEWRSLPGPTEAVNALAELAAR